MRGITLEVRGVSADGFRHRGLKTAGFSLISPVIVVNPSEYGGLMRASGAVKPGDTLITNTCLIALDVTVLFTHNDGVALFLKHRWLRLVLAAYMGVAMMGTFIFVLMESLPEARAAGDVLTPGGVFASIDYAIDCLFESESATGKAGRHSYSVARNGFLRIITPAELQNSETFFSRLSLRTIAETNHFNKKNSILLKLRI
jgi:hypothetical protein